MIAIWMLGATAVPIDFRASGTERQRLAHEFDLFAILEDRKMPAARYESILVDDAWNETIARYERHPLWTSKEGAAALISLTSGTTGRPLGIALDHHGALLRFVLDLSQRFGARLLNPLPLAFSASCSHSFAALIRGSAVYFYPVLSSAQELTEAILRLNAGSVCAVPTIARNLLDITAERSSPIFQGLDAFYCFGAPMGPEEKLRAKRHLCNNFVQEYGSSLCGRMSSLKGSDLEARPDSVGRVLPHVVLQIVDPDDQLLRCTEAGAVRMRSPSMACSLLGEPSASGDKFKGGWAYPGDVGILDKDGFLCLLGRTSDVIIRGGANVHPAEIEAVIAELDGVREVVVTAFTKLPEGEEIAAVVVPSDGLSEAALIAHCRARLSPDKRPREFVFLENLPRNANGKISRQQLRQQIERSQAPKG